MVSVPKVNGISDPTAQPDKMPDDVPNWVSDPWYPMISSREGREDCKIAARSTRSNRSAHGLELQLKLYMAALLY